MSLPIPIHTAYEDENNCQVFKFGTVDVRHDLDGRYRACGAVCWPIANQPDASLSNGYILGAAESLQTGILHVFMESEFIVIDPILRADGGIKYPGLSQWLNEAWAKLACNKFYWTGETETHRTYLLSVIRSRNIEPKPGFIELPKIPEEQAVHSLNTLFTTEQIKINADGKLMEALKVAEVRPGPYPPPILAAITLAAGVQRFPYRRPW